MIHQNIDNTYIFQIIFMLIAFVFMALVLREQWVRLQNSRTEYIKSRKILFTLVSLVFLGNFSHFEPGHFIHSVLLALVGFTWWYWYRIVALELADNTKLEATLKELAKEMSVANEAELKSVKIHQESQSEAIAEQAPDLQQKINDLTAVKNIAKAAESDNENENK